MAVVARTVEGIGWFLNWWLGQLKALLPPAVRRLFRARADTIVVDVSEGEARIVRCDESAGHQVGRFAFGPDGASEEEVASARRALAAAGTSRRATALRLPADRALRKTLTLPAAAEGSLREVLFHQIGEHTPFPAEEACFGFRVASRDSRAGTIEVELTVVPRKFVEAALERAAAWGLRPDIVDISTGGPVRAPEFNLIEVARERGRMDFRPRLQGLMAVAAGVLAVAAVFIPLDNARERAQTLRAEVVELRRASQEVLDLRARRDALVMTVQLLSGPKLSRPSTLKILDELTRIVPEDTWLYEVHLNGREIRVSGYSPSASALIGRIAESPLFDNPRFRSPVTRPAKLEKERFNLSFELAVPAAEAEEGK